MRFLLIVAALLSAMPVAAQDTSSDARELRRLHDELLEAHRAKDVDRWMAVEAPTVVSANGGRISFSDAAERRPGRAAYLEGATFELYRDLREPIVRVSEDGSLGWLIAEVEVKGTFQAESGPPAAFHDIWAWVELYEKVDGTWLLTGNVSNSRPG